MSTHEGYEGYEGKDPYVNAPRIAIAGGTGAVGHTLLRLLRPMHEEYGLRRVTVATYQATSGGGQRGIEELRDGTRNVLAGLPVAAERFPEPLAFNVVPAIDSFQDDGFTLEERKMRQ